MKLKSYRIKAKKTQAAAAHELGVTKQHYEKVENKKLPAGRKLGWRIVAWSNGEVSLEEVCSSEA